jgi:TPR repeat protein
MGKLGRVAAATVVVFVAAGVALIAYAVRGSDGLLGFLAKRADAGDPEAQVALGLSTVGFWFIVPKDDAKAVELFRRAAEEGSAAGKFHLRVF